MFRNFLTKSFFRLVFIAALVLFLGVFMYAFRLDVTNVGPSDMRTHFSYNSDKAVPANGATSVDLKIRNHSSREIADMLGNIIAECLTFDKGNFVYNSGVMRDYFTPEGYTQYQAFLNKTSFQTTLTQNNLQSGVILETQPLELASGVYGGAYKWVFEVPVTLSFIPQNADSYRDEVITPQNRRFILRIQLARVPDPINPEAVRIEIWQVLPPRG